MRTPFLCFALLAACSDDSVDSNENARRAYLGLDPSVGQCITLGFDGFNTASSANILPQMDTGTKAGTLTINGQVDQGQSANKGMRLTIAMVGFDDGPFEINTNHDKIDVVYDTSTDVTMQPALDIMMMNIPTGTLSGTLTGTYTMTGDLKGDVTLDLTITGDLMDGGGGAVVRKTGTTHVTGTAISGNGTFDVDVTL
jgi:hypothetical protein